MVDPVDQAALDYWHGVEFFNIYDLDEQLEKARKHRPVHLLGPEQMIDGTWDSASVAPRLLYLLPFPATEATRIVAAQLSEPEAWQSQDSSATHDLSAAISSSIASLGV
ncbi:hypothetical protein, partial [Xanthomonas oryzae]|uniref:hypothetical protein n=2 Tax=Xanthomonas oryzae TaxID=347 RepID=UPI000B624CEE